MKIYIASSWKNQHGVELLTTVLRDQGFTVISWIDNSYGEKLHEGYDSLAEWIDSPNGAKAFEFDTNGATTCDLFILYTYAGCDAYAEMGAAWAKGIPIIGLKSKGSSPGLMQKMVSVWYERILDVLKHVVELYFEQHHGNTDFNKLPQIAIAGLQTEQPAFESNNTTCNAGNFIPAGESFVIDLSTLHKMHQNLNYGTENKACNHAS